MRNNPGGLLTQVINITDIFKYGEIVSTKGQISETRKFFAKKGDEINGKPLIVLINNIKIMVKFTMRKDQKELLY